MPRIRLTKTELKKQKESLRRFSRYLPMLLLKKKQLQLEILKIHQKIKEIASLVDKLRGVVMPWVDVFSEEVSLENILKLKSIETTLGNVAGINLPLFKQVLFDQKEYDLMSTPLWVDKALEMVKNILTQKAELFIYHRQLKILKEELRVATQRVNLFEKVKIPQAQENIRVIQICVGELRTAEVVRGKISKAKIEKRRNQLYQ